MALRARCGKWHFRFKFNGKEYAETTGLADTEENRTEAQQCEFDYRRALKDGASPTQEIVICQFDDAVKKFLAWAKAKFREHPSSFRRIKTSLASALQFFKADCVSLIDPGRIDDYASWRVTEHDVRDITIRHDLHALSSFFQYAIRKHWTKKNPIDEVEIPSDADAVRMHVLTPIEEMEYFNRAQKFPNLHDVCRLMVNQGMRPEEVTVLAKEDIDLDRGLIHIRKGKSTASKRVLDMTTESRAILLRRMEGESPWIFPSKRRHGKPIGRINSAHDSLVAEAAKEGVTINFVPYDLRHTFATRVAQENIDLPTLAALLGHASIRMVQKYVHPTAGHKKAAMARYDQSIMTAEKESSRESLENRNSTVGAEGLSMPTDSKVLGL
jgi:integrase